ncbi:MAG: Bax inhibitor-1 family protein [Candidatus Peribacteraceae bacterium]|nr:Bax inhibitor-1 family protein [Candidatus Peribacteraceae bacterium]
MNPRFMPVIDVQTGPIASRSLSQVYLLLFLAFAFTVLGCAAGATVALSFMNTGVIMVLFLLQLAIVWTAPSWTHSTPLNYFLFVSLPFLAGLTLTPVIISVLVGYANGATILMNALIATGLMTLSSALLATITKTDLGGMFGRFLLQALLGLIGFGLLQIFFPSLRGQLIEQVVSGIGIVVFSIFLAVDIQRLQRRSNLDSPFLIAIAIYLDIFNLFLFILRFMTAGGRRD